MLFAGCSIYMASTLPIARSPENLRAEMTMEQVDSKYGFPIAMGVNSEGCHTEQIQFIDGVRIGWKVARFCTHSVLDALSYGLWEFIGTPYEALNRNYPIYVYYVIYDEQNRVVRKVNADSDEGRQLSKLNWTVPYIENLKVNKDKKLRQQHLGKCIDNVVPEKTVVKVPKAVKEVAVSSSYEIDKFEREQGDEFAYSFELTANNPLSFGEVEKIKRELRQSILEDYRMAFGSRNGISLQADFPEFSISKNRIVGKAVIMQLSVQSLTYDADHSKGVIRVKMGAYSFEEVRRIVRRNIENIVRDKNIALATGEIPPETRFCIGNERVTDEGIMEIEFEAL